MNGAKKLLQEKIRNIYLIKYMQLVKKIYG